MSAVVNRDKMLTMLSFFFSSSRRHTRCYRDWSSDVCSSDLGGEVLTGTPVTSLDQLPPSRVVLLDVTPRQLLHLGGDRLSPRYRRRLRAYRYGPGAFKIDWRSEERRVGKESTARPTTEQEER